MEEDKKGIDASFFIGKPVILFIDDKDRVQRRDGIFKGFDHTHYYLEMTYGSQKGQVMSFLRTYIKRIQLADNQNSNGGDFHG